MPLLVPAVPASVFPVPVFPVPVFPAPAFPAHHLKIGHHWPVLAGGYAAPSLASLPNASRPDGSSAGGASAGSLSAGGSGAGSSDAAAKIDRLSSPGLTVSADDIPSEKLTQFVTAYSGVMTLIRRNESLVQTAETEQESTRIQQAIETAAVQLIEQAGLTRSEYIQLLSLANLDDEFGEKIVTLLQEKS